MPYVLDRNSRPPVDKGYLPAPDCNNKPINRNRQPQPDGKIIDPYDLQLRPIFETIGKLHAFSVETGRYLSYTDHEHQRWIAASPSVL